MLSDGGSTPPTSTKHDNAAHPGGVVVWGVEIQSASFCSDSALVQ